MQVKSWLTPFSLTPHRSKKVRATSTYFTDTSSHEGSNFAPSQQAKCQSDKRGSENSNFSSLSGFYFFIYIVVYIEEKKSPPEGWSRQRGMYHHSLEISDFCSMKWPRKMLQNLCLFLEYKTQHMLFFHFVLLLFIFQNQAFCWGITLWIYLLFLKSAVLS